MFRSDHFIIYLSGITLQQNITVIIFIITKNMQYIQKIMYAIIVHILYNQILSVFTNRQYQFLLHHNIVSRMIVFILLQIKIKITLRKRSNIAENIASKMNLLRLFVMSYIQSVFSVYGINFVQIRLGAHKITA